MHRSRAVHRRCRPTPQRSRAIAACVATATRGRGTRFPAGNSKRSSPRSLHGTAAIVRVDRQRSTMYWFRVARLFVVGFVLVALVAIADAQVDRFRLRLSYLMMDSKVYELAEMMGP